MLDTHCHLNDAQYDADREQVISEVFSSGIEKVICVGADFSSSETAKQLAESHENVYYSVGIHPDECDSYNQTQFEKLITTGGKKLVAVGEIGLDYFHNKENKEKQIEVFSSQVELAIKHNLPIIIHCREAYGDTLAVLKKHALKVPVVFHCYSGSLDYARELIKMGVKISFTGSVTFKNATNVQEVAKNIPLGSFFFETDSPYLSPVPHRGERNTPKNVWDVANFVANLRGMSCDELVKLTDKTAKEFFNLN